ncbi:MAG: hypothetical protein ACKVVP_14950 [Chloroflexota bacterium]
MVALGIAALIFLASYGYGLPLLRRMETLPSAALERLLFASLLGAGILTFLILGVGLVGGLSPLFGWAVIAPGLVLTIRGLPRPVWGDTYRALARTWRGLREGGILVWGCWLFLLLSAGLNLIAALAPVSGTDVLAYHLAIPRLYAEEGRIRYVPGVYYSTAAFGLEMLFTLAILLGSAVAAQVIHFVFGILAATAVYVIAVRAISPRAGLLGAALFYAVTDVSVQSSIALIDLGAAAYLLAALIAALRWREQGGYWFLLVGILAGLHAGTKMPNLTAAGALWITMALDVAWRRQVQVSWRPLISAGVITVLLASPWFLRSWAWTGNPLYPYFNSVFHGRDFSAEASERQLAIQYYKTIGDRSPERLLLAPLTLTVTPDAFRSGYLGPIHLAFIPFIFLVPLSRSTRLLLVFALVSLPIWFFLYPRLRTLLTVVGALSGLVAASALALCRLHPITQWITILSLLLWSATSLAANGRYHLPALPVVFGLESEDAFLRRRLPQPDSLFLWYDDFMILNQTLPADAVVLLWDTRGYYLERSYIWANAVAQGLIPLERQREPADLVAALRERGVTHVAMVPGDAPAGSDVPIVRLQYTLQSSGNLKEIYRSATMTLTELKR